MATVVQLSFTNSHDVPLHLQVDPWANLYRIEPHQEFSIVAESDTDKPRLDFDWRGNDLIVTIVDSSEFYVLQAGKRLHHLRECRTNVVGM